MKQYQDLLKTILKEGVWKDAARQNMPRTISLFGTRMQFDMSEGFPLLTTKKMYYKAIFVELIWFLKGDTNIKYLVDNKCNIWNKDAYRWYLKQWNEYDDCYDFEKGLDNENPWNFDIFVDLIKKGEIYQTAIPSEYTLGDLGKVYGYQWRNQNGVDQVKEVIEGIKSNPYSRYHIIDAWQKSDFAEMALPPCHLLYQFNCRKDENQKFVLDLQMYQRSVDSFLGLPFNIASASLLLHIVAKTVNMKPGVFTWIGGDTHIYENHLDQVNELLIRDPLLLPSISINKDICTIEDVEQLKLEDIKISGYDSYPPIKAELSVGL